MWQVLRHSGASPPSRRVLCRDEIEVQLVRSAFLSGVVPVKGALDLAREAAWDRGEGGGGGHVVQGQSGAQSSWQLELFGGEVTVDLDEYRRQQQQAAAPAPRPAAAAAAPMPQPIPLFAPPPRLPLAAVFLPRAAAAAVAAAAVAAAAAAAAANVAPSRPSLLSSLVSPKEKDNKATGKRKAAATAATTDATAANTGPTAAKQQRKLSAAFGGGGAEMHQSAGEQLIESDADFFCMQTKDGMRRASYAPPLSKQDFELLDRFCRNCGKSEAGLSKFLELVLADQQVGVALIWRDLTSNHGTVSEKHCTPSQQCNRWNCVCDRHIRGAQATKPLLGAVFNLASDPNRAYLLPLAPCPSDDGAGAIEAETETAPPLPLQGQTTLAARWHAFWTILNYKPLAKIMYNSKIALLPIVYECKRRSLSVVNFENIWDLRTAAYLRNSDVADNELELDYLFSHSSHSPTAADVENDAPAGLQGRLPRCLAAVLAELKCIRALMVARRAELEQIRAWQSFVQVETPLLVVLAELEARGVAVREGAMVQLDQALRARLSDVKSEAQILLATANSAAAASVADFNMASPEQVSHVLYDVLGCPKPASTSAKGKHFSTSEETLQNIKHSHRIVGLVLEFRSISKILSAFIEGLQYFFIKSTVAGNDWTVHAEWNSTTTRTGRMSCCKPNIQQIPKPDIVGNVPVNIRSFFIPSSAQAVFVSGDYSQIEMRVLAHFCNDSSLLGLFQRGGDVYLIMASMIFGKEEALISKDERNRAKTCALGIIYGLGAAGLANRMKCPVSEAQSVMNRFYSLFSSVKRWMESVKDNARKCGFVTTITGWRRLLPDIHSTVQTNRAAAERQAINTIIQGTAADIIKVAMVACSRGIEKDFGHLPIDLRPQLIFAVHDELVYQVNRTVVSQFVALQKNVMETEVRKILRLNCVLKLTVEVGPDWGTLTPFVE